MGTTRPRLGVDHVTVIPTDLRDREESAADGDANADDDANADGREDEDGD